MANADKEKPVEVDVAAKLAELEAQNAELQEQVLKLSTRAPSKAELQKAREEREAKRRAEAAKRDAESKDVVVIHKFNRDGDLTRERTCAKVDVAYFEKQGYKVAK